VPSKPEQISDNGQSFEAVTMAALAPAAGNGKEETAPVSVSGIVLPVAKPAQEAKITALETGIQKILNAGSEFFVSQKKVAIAKGDTLMDLLVKNSVPRNEAYEAIQALRKVYDPRALNPGHAITVYFHQDPAIADPTFSGLEIEKDVISSVRVSRDENGGYKADKEEKEVNSVLKGFSGKIDSSLYVSAKAQGVPDSVIIDLIRMYSWGVDFQRDIQTGDAFEVMYEQYQTADGAVVPGKGDIVYAKLTLSGNDMPFYLYKDSAGDADYFDETGQSAKKTLMKTPIDGARLSSGFGMRKHPVLGYSKMHKGVDFAAPRGTPIYAAGDGTIVRIGPFSSYGKYVKIRHRNGLETAYAHLNGFKAGLKSGSRVKQGQVIGYVGSTGRSTGPHLHYEVIMSGRQVNPNSIKLPTGKALAGADLKKFKSVVASLDSQFSKIGRNTAVASVR
jgi:murein DD-endopeptidase MepM/ murein hydrolase activator NlpD